ncbi:hypothetical protein BST61_g11449 [Cercospora zeina]
MEDHIDRFFSAHPSFPYDRTNSAPREFYRLCDHFGWHRGSNGKYPPAREEEWRKFRIAMVIQFNSSFGVDALDTGSWEGICAFLGMNPVPSDIDSMRKAVLNTHVNLADMLDSKRSGEQFTIFNTKEELVDYTIREGRYFPKEEAYAGGLLKYLLREIHNSYQGSRDRNRQTKSKGRGGKRMKRG